MTCDPTPQQQQQQMFWRWALAHIHKEPMCLAGPLHACRDRERHTRDPGLLFMVPCDMCSRGSLSCYHYHRHSHKARRKIQSKDPQRGACQGRRAALHTTISLAVAAETAHAVHAVLGQVGEGVMDLEGARRTIILLSRASKLPNSISCIDLPNTWDTCSW